MNLNTKEAKEYVDAKMRHWLDLVPGVNLNSPNDILTALRFAAYEDWIQRNEGRDDEPMESRR